MRPGGMLVQRRNPDSDRNITPPPTIRVRVKYGSVYHRINISSQSSFGIYVWPGTQMHNHNYRTPGPFQDQVVMHMAKLCEKHGGGEKEVVVIVDDPVSLAKKNDAIRSSGPSKLQIIADFDSTLTRYCVNGCRGQSSHSLLQQGNPEFDLKRQKLYEYYHPIEISPTIPVEEKAKLMEV